jgi:hypothetical protein
VSPDFSALPESIRTLAELVDLSARIVLVDGRLYGVAAADAALDRVGDETPKLIEQATERRVLEIAFERNAAGQGAR